MTKLDDRVYQYIDRVKQDLLLALIAYIIEQRHQATYGEISKDLKCVIGKSNVSLREAINHLLEVELVDIDSQKAYSNTTLGKQALDLVFNDLILPMHKVIIRNRVVKQNRSSNRSLLAFVPLSLLLGDVLQHLDFSFLN